MAVKVNRRLQLCRTASRAMTGSLSETVGFTAKTWFERSFFTRAGGLDKPFRETPWAAFFLSPLTVWLREEFDC